MIALTALLAIALAVLFWRQVANTRRMRAMAMTDELTRLPNRRHILAALESTFAAAKRDGRPVAVIVFDIDRFKRINDTYGHAAGDEVLQTVARTCRLALRPADQIGRIGGEEFLIVVHPPPARRRRDIAERLRAAVEQLDFSAIAEALQSHDQPRRLAHERIRRELRHRHGGLTPLPRERERPQPRGDGGRRYRRALNFTVASFSPVSTLTEIGASKLAAIS